jgi:hypothetical protein
LFKAKTEEDLLQQVKSDSNFSLFHDTLQENLNKLNFNVVPVKELKLPYSASEIVSLLEEIEMYKEIELWDKTERIFLGLW